MLFLKRNEDYSTIYNFVKENSFNSYWYKIIETAKDEENYSSDLYTIYNENEIVGCVEIFSGVEDLYVSMIEISNKYNQLGTKTIKALFDLYDDTEIITGESLPQAIEFWYKIGASFDCDEEHLSLDELLNFEMSLSFSLNKEDFLKYLKSEVI